GAQQRAGRVEQPGRRRADRHEEAVQPRPYRTGGRRVVGDEPVEVHALVRIEPQRGGERTNDACARVPVATLLQTDVVIEAHAGARGPLGTAQTRRLAPSGTGHVRAAPGPPATQELAQALSVAHRSSLARALRTGVAVAEPSRATGSQRMLALMTPNHVLI